MAPHAAKFLYEFWTHPETLRSLCEAAGEDLIPVFDLELGHTNVSMFALDWTSVSLTPQRSLSLLAAGPGPFSS